MKESAYGLFGIGLSYCIGSIMSGGKTRDQARDVVIYTYIVFVAISIWGSDDWIECAWMNIALLIAGVLGIEAVDKIDEESRKSRRGDIFQIGQIIRLSEWILCSIGFNNIPNRRRRIMRTR